MNSSEDTILNLDLSYLVQTLVEREEWRRDEAEDAVRRYKNFLILHKKYPANRNTPTDEIDAVWHAHILHTRRYIADCEACFGEYYHHAPSEEEQKQMWQYFLKTKELYEKEFNEPFSSVPAIATFW